MRAVVLLAVAFTACASSSPASQVQVPSLPPARDIAEFESHLEQLRVALRIPAYSAAIAKGSEVVWSKGFGQADVAASVPATPETQYHLASLTKPFASVILLQLVESGRASLDDPVSTYGIALESPGTIRVRHLLSHTSQGEPGSQYRYSGDRFGLLDSVIIKTTGQSFARLLVERILRPLGLQRTAPNPLSPADFTAAGIDRDAYVARMAKPYESGSDVLLPSYPRYFGTAAGLVSTASDVARFSIALDTNAFLRPETRAMAFSPTISTRGETLPYGLGWFTTRHGGENIVWHYGYWTGNSSLIVKVPSRALTFVILANSDMLSRPTRLGSGDLMSSSLAREFINAFVTGTARLP